MNLRGMWIVGAIVLLSAPPGARAQDDLRKKVLAGAGAAATVAAASEAGSEESLPEKLRDELEGEGERGPAGPESPRGSVQAYLSASNRGDWPEAARYLDLDDVPKTERAEGGPALAKRLKVVLDQKLWIDPAKLSRSPDGKADDDLPPHVDEVGTIALGDTGRAVDVTVARHVGPDGKAIWRFTPGVVSRIDTLYAEYGYGPIGDYLPNWAVSWSFLHVQLWQWVGFLVAFAIAYGVSFAISWILHAFAGFLTRRTKSTFDDEILDAIHRPVRWILALLFFGLATLPLHLSVPAWDGLVRVLSLALIVCVAWGGVRLIDALFQGVGTRMRAQGRSDALAILAITRRSLKALAIVLALLALLQTQGFNVTGLLAGLGIAGIAVSLAAQKTLENIFGGVVLSADQPVRVGDFCRFGDRVGTVEDIGLRSTKVRTLDRTVVSVPNAEFSTIQLENFTLRDKIFLKTTLGLRYETSPDQMRWVLHRLREMLLAHPRVEREPFRVRFANFGAASLDLEIFAYVNTTDFTEFCTIREDLFLRIMDVVNQSGTGFAFPSQTLYMARDTGLDEEATKAAEEAVAAWRKKGELPYPDIPADRVEKLRGTLDYPPKGSLTKPPEAVRED